MKTTRLWLSLTLFLLAAPALARPNPNPPPSGIVIHLFGPHGIANHILPTFAGGAMASSAAPGAAGATTPGAPSGTPATAGRATPASYPAPTIGEVLHQMFVVGDPNQKPGAALAPGRAAEHPRAVNQ